jgi:DNA-binding HxlR family transcriptional regulator
MTTPHFSQPTPYHERPQPAQPDPALARAFALLGEPWNGLIIATLARGPAGTAQIRERVPGIGDDTLADRLQGLTTADHVTRIAHPGPPPRSQYALTPHGNALLIPLAALTVWAQDHLPARDSPAPGRPCAPHA